MIKGARLLVIVCLFAHNAAGPALNSTLRRMLLSRLFYLMEKFGFNLRDPFVRFSQIGQECAQIPLVVMEVVVVVEEVGEESISRSARAVNGVRVEILGTMTGLPRDHREAVGEFRLVAESS